MAKKVKKPVFDEEHQHIVKVAKEKEKLSKRKTKIDPLKEIPIEDYSGVEHIQATAELYRTEWAVGYPTIGPWTYLLNIKLLSESRARQVLTAIPAKGWYEYRVRLQNDLTKKILDRHIDLVADVTDKYIKATDLGFARIVEMLGNKGIPKLDKEGNQVINKDGNPVYLPLRPIDMLNLTSALKTNMEIYRKAMGFNDNEGITQVLERINLTQVNIHEQPKREVAIDPITGEEIVIEDETKESSVNTIMSQLSYDDIKAMVKRARQLTSEAKTKEGN